MLYVYRTSYVVRSAITATAELVIRGRRRSRKIWLNFGKRS